MRFKLSRCNKYNEKVVRFLDKADITTFSRLYDGIIIQKINNKLIIVETADIIVDNISEEIKEKFDIDNLILRAYKNTMNTFKVEELNDGMYIACGPGLSNNFDGFNKFILMPFNENSKKYESVEQVTAMIKDNNWYGVSIISSRGDMLKCYLLSRQFFNIEMVDNKAKKEIIEQITNEVYSRTMADRAAINSTVKDLLSEKVIYNYVVSGGNVNNFINLIVKTIRQ